MNSITRIEELTARKPVYGSEYVGDLIHQLSTFDWSNVERVGHLLFDAWCNQQAVFICGNGGSAANAIHLANDFIYGINPGGRSMNAVALSANSSVLTCLANDTGYENIYAHQLRNAAKPGDVLIVLSGSGNSENIIRALSHACELGMHTVAVLGFDGGKSRLLCDHALHFPVGDMQISEDLQVVVGHMLMKQLKEMISTHDC